MNGTKKTVVIGVGEMGGVFARALLRSGYEVFPVTRKMPARATLEAAGDPEAVVVAVGEKDLHPVLEEIPSGFFDRIVLIQNELLPRDWQAHGIPGPTVISAWFEKKYPNDYKVIIPSPVFGPRSALIQEALATLNIPARGLKNRDELLFELIVKNLYILTVNIAGIKVGGTVGELWSRHETFTRDVADDVLDIQFKLAGRAFDREDLLKAMLKAFRGDPGHKCTGRSAPARLERAIKQAQEAGIPVKTLKEIQKT